MHPLNKVKLFHYVCRTGRKRVFDMLLNDVDVNCRNEHGHTPLMTVVKEGNLEFVKILIENGADPNIGDEWGITALLMAVFKGHLDIVDYLLPLSERTVATAFYGQFSIYTAAVLTGDPQILHFILQKNIPQIDTPIDLTETTPMTLSVFLNNAALVRLLVEYGANKNVPDSVEIHNNEIRHLLGPQFDLDTTPDHSLTPNLTLHSPKFSTYKSKALTWIKFIKIRSKSSSPRKRRPSHDRDTEAIIKHILRTTGHFDLWPLLKEKKIDSKSIFALKRNDWISLGVKAERVGGLLQAISRYKEILRRV